jgi:hypothetical protein
VTLALNLRIVEAADHCEVLRLLAKRNTNLGSHRTRVFCRLHALLAKLAPGGIAKELYVSNAGRLLAKITPHTPAEQVRYDLALELLDAVRRLDAQTQESTAGSESPSRRRAACSSRSMGWARSLPHR